MRAPLVATLLIACSPARPPRTAEESPDPPMAAMIDPAVDPCDDFYRHACGGWASGAQIEPSAQVAEPATDLVHARTDRILRDILESSEPAGGELGRLRTFHASCMASGVDAERARERALTRRMDRIAAIRTRGQLEVVLRELHREGIQAFFGYSGQPDRTDPARFRGQIEQGVLGLRRGQLTDPSPEGEKRRTEYRAHLARMFELAGVEPAGAEREATGVLAIEVALARASLSFADSFDPAVSEHPMAVDQLGALAPAIDWRAYLAMAEHPAGQPINVAAPDYLRELDRQLRRPATELAAFLRWRLLDALGPALPRSLADEHRRFLAGDVAPPSRRDECRLATVKAMGIELSRQFSRRAVPPEARDRADQIARAVRDSIAGSIAWQTWLSPEACRATEEKVRMASLKIGYPASWPEAGTFALRPDDFLENLLAARSHEQRRAWRRAGRARSRESWEMTVYPNGAPGMAAARLMIPNGFPDAFSNSMILTAALLQPPRFDAAAPREVQLATLGALIAHELVHALEAHQFDGSGALRDRWSPADVEAHRRRRACVVAQAGQFTGPDGIRLDGELTVDENVADLGGVVHAYRTMDRTGAPSTATARRFFYAYAQRWCAVVRPAHERERFKTDPHAPPAYRVNGPLSNMPEFSAAFSCSAGARMIHSERCSVW